jgi:hypothetical protein
VAAMALIQAGMLLSIVLVGQRFSRGATVAPGPS